MKPPDVTVIIIAWNEEDNLPRCLEALEGMPRILVVDSGSTDRTLEICARDARVRVLSRRFDHFADQVNFGLKHVETPWVLSIDADYLAPPGFAAHLQSLDDALAGFRCRFVYQVFGHSLRASLYPPRTVLYRREGARYRRDGHAHRVAISGPVGWLPEPFRHDDRKPIERWYSAQLRYAADEAEKLAGGRARGAADKIRGAMWIAPWLVPLWCLFVKGCLFDGWPGWYYSCQRAIAELLLSLELADRKLRGGTKQ